MLPKISKGTGSENEIFVGSIIDATRRTDKACILNVDVNSVRPACSVTAANHQGLVELKDRVIGAQMIDSFCEMAVIAHVLVVATNWAVLVKLMEKNILLHDLLTCALMLAVVISSRLARTRSLIRHLPRFIYMAFLTSVLLIMGIQIPFLFGPNILTPHFVVLASATVAGVYLFLSILAFSGVVRITPPASFLYGMVMILYVLVVSQAVYIIAFVNTPYAMYMCNVGMGLLFAAYISLAQIHYNMKCVDSGLLDEETE